MYKWKKKEKTYRPQIFLMQQVWIEIKNFLDGLSQNDLLDTFDQI